MRAFLTIILCSVSVALAAQTGTPLITSQDLLDGLKDPTRWLTYGGDYNSQRHSPLTQITPENVNQLTAQWTFQTGTTGSFAICRTVISVRSWNWVARSVVQPMPDCSTARSVASFMPK